jgi:molybdate/tungstate transport system substrate-binding protein
VKRPMLAGLVTCVAAMALAACGSSSSSSGPVSVIYAGSLTGMMEHVLGPDFHNADGYSFDGFGAGSGEAAQQIKGGMRQADVFVSASADADKELEGQANGEWVSWYATFATTPLVLGYDPDSTAGRQLVRGEPWYRVIAQPGVRVGRTDPKLDPKGKLTVEAVEQATTKLDEPRLLERLASFPVFPETDLVGRLQAGQLDAGFFYAAEASAAHIPTVALNPVSKTASYTVTIVNRAAHLLAAEAFVRYLLSAQGASSLARSGLRTVTSPRLEGPATSVPAGVQSVIALGGH